MWSRCTRSAAAPASPTSRPTSPPSWPRTACASASSTPTSSRLASTCCSVSRATTSPRRSTTSSSTGSRSRTWPSTSRHRACPAASTSSPRASSRGRSPGCCARLRLAAAGPGPAASSSTPLSSTLSCSTPTPGCRRRRCSPWSSPTRCWWSCGPDQQDYEGTGVTVHVAKELEVPRIALVVNKSPTTFDPAVVRERVEQAYDCPVVAVLPHSDAMMALGSAGIFSLAASRRPAHHRDGPGRRLRPPGGGVSRTPEREEGQSLSRAELLGGLAGRRVSTAMYVIESRTAYLALKARNATAPALSAGVLEEQERVFLSALAAGRDLPAPTIQELDQFAPQWAYLVPTDAVARAELAHRIGDKYRYRESDVGPDAAGARPRRPVGPAGLPRPARRRVWPTTTTPTSPSWRSCGGPGRGCPGGSRSCRRSGRPTG